MAEFISFVLQLRFEESANQRLYFRWLSHRFHPLWVILSKSISTEPPPNFEEIAVALFPLQFIFYKAFFLVVEPVIIFFKSINIETSSTMFLSFMSRLFSPMDLFPAVLTTVSSTLNHIFQIYWYRNSSKLLGETTLHDISNILFWPPILFVDIIIIGYDICHYVSSFTFFIIWKLLTNFRVLYL